MHSNNFWVPRMRSQSRCRVLESYKSVGNFGQFGDRQRTLTRVTRVTRVTGGGITDMALMGCGQCGQCGIAGIHDPILEDRKAFYGLDHLDHVDCKSCGRRLFKIGSRFQDRMLQRLEIW